MVNATAAHHGTRIHITVLGQEGDSKPLTIGTHQTCAHLLHEGLEALYGDPTPPAGEYDLVLGGRNIEPLSETVTAAGIVAGATVSILPKTISRGMR